MKNSMEVPQNLEIELLYDSAIPLLYIYPIEKRLKSQRLNPMVIDSLITSKMWKHLNAVLNG